LRIGCSGGRIFRPKWDRLTGEWRRPHGEELNDLSSSPNVIGVIELRFRWTGLVACMGERRGSQGIMVGRPEGRKPLGRPRHRWKDNIKMDLKEVQWGAWTVLV
jgi:hypothetical protein